MVNGGAASLVPLDDFSTRFRGLVLPIDKKPGGFFHTAFTREIIKSSINMILLTRRGERVMLPEFGSNVHLLVFEPNDQILRSLVERYITDDLARWEPRIRLLSIRTLTFDNEHALQVHLEYEIISVGVEDAVTLVFRSESQGEVPQTRAL